MGDQQLEYLEFQADEVHYLIPCPGWTESVRERKKREEPS